MPNEIEVTPQLPQYTSPVGLLEAALHSDTPVHTMGPVVTSLLANPEVVETPLYTTETARDPGSLSDFLREKKRREAGEFMADAIGNQFVYMPGYSEEKETALTELSEALGSVTAINADDVHVNKDGTVRASSMTFQGADPTMLSHAFQGLLHTPEGVRHPVDTLEDGSVRVGNMTEYNARVIARGMNAVLRKRQEANGLTLPPENTTATQWKEAGETLSPTTQADLDARNDRYHDIKVTATYRDRPEMQVDKLDEMLGSEAVPALARVRDIFRPLIKETRDSTRHNLPQDPDKKARLSIEQDVRLKRDKRAAETNGPQPSRPPKTHEEASERLRSFRNEVRRKPVTTGYHLIVEGMGKATGGAQDGAITALHYLPEAYRRGRTFAGDVRTWRGQKRAYRADQQKVTRAAQQVLERHLY